MSVDQDDYCDDYRPIPWQNALQSCPTPEQQQQQQQQQYGEVPTKQMRAPGVDLKGGAEISSPGSKPHPADTTVVVVTATAGMEHNGSGSTNHMADGLPDVHHMMRQEVIHGGHALHHNMSAEIGTV